MEILDRSGLVRLKDWTKFAHPISITLGSKNDTYEYSIPADQQKLIFTSKGEAGNGYFPQHIVWSGMQDSFGPVSASNFSKIVFNLQYVSIAGSRILLFYTANYYNTINNHVYVITAKILKTSTISRVTFMMNGPLNSSL